MLRLTTLRVLFNIENNYKKTYLLSLNLLLKKLISSVYEAIQQHSYDQYKEKLKADLVKCQYAEYSQLFFKRVGFATNDKQQ